MNEVMLVDQLATPHGRCAIVEVTDEMVEDALAALPAAEQAHAQRLSPVRRRELVAGRTALHAALAELAPALATAPILPDDRGAPVLPAGWVGSVSHKGTRAAALIAPASEARIGIDLERAAPPRGDIARRILTARELAALADRDPARGSGVTLRFSIKEAIYKAVDPFVRRYVAFTEVELDVIDHGVDDGVAHVRSELPLAIETTWRELGGFWLSTARAMRR